ncbi:hypothetical protein ACFQ48_01865 [Hymenobacter caeli]|uniref:Uncharacterized protein n=1 Tax=Hymenobacter caeli TaxID=2735894 RepID=A0ABX2FMB5_9BACT|nr:hypothetical protein [Hymenobacter caeli]NRT17569.1 hypothetical protein [Hymenobacter caeli]
MKPRLVEQSRLRKWGLISNPQLHLEMKKGRAKQLWQEWGKPVLLELLKGAAKAIGLLLLTHLLG